MGIQRIVCALIGMLPLGIGLVDVGLFKWWGNSATISWIMLSISSKYPLVPAFMAYSCGVLMRHCFVPVVTTDVPYVPDVVGRMFLVLSPCFYWITVVCFADLGDPQNAKFRFGWWGLVASIVLGFVIGVWAGRFLTQHIDPGQPDPSPA